ncbi:MAG: glycosyltransferase family 4 protein [Desulfobacteraceae bacterium]|nr:glycosyltransferase family 1 protein [Desulfobacteraceae bacterium]MBC2756480.1 glycosyltransferase family 4 protein [Desulfobacteraceae bacterium]
MKIAFLHYHLKPGGVTTVIKQQINAVKDDGEILVITGEPPPDHFPFKTILIPEIGYDQPHKKCPEPEKIAQKIINAISDHWKSGCDVLHVHNPLLAKNRILLKILSALSESNIRLFLQIHDFAEDGRPWVYYANEPYPSDCHFGVINSRDFDILLKSGLKRPGLHLLLNMVTPFNVSAERKLSAKIVLYPVRAIRRKNIGEAILLSLFFRKNEVLAITLPPNSPEDWKPYNSWKQFAAEKKLNVIFEASGTYNFTDLVKSAKRMITTSISEGFGFSYLEPWTAGQMLTGRSLSEICMDFTKKGMFLDHLYKKFSIPIETIEIDFFYEKWKSCILDNAAKFKISISDSAIAQAYENLTSSQCIDFAILDESFQKQVIEKILSDKNFKSRVMDLNPFLSDITHMQDQDVKIRHNRLIVETEFNQSGYRNRLLDTYQKVIHNIVSHKIDKQILAKEFLNPENFSLLKWGDHHV